jgi:hypothetical protein
MEGNVDGEDLTEIKNQATLPITSASTSNFQ